MKMFRGCKQYVVLSVVVVGGGGVPGSCSFAAHKPNHVNLNSICDKVVFIHLLLFFV